MARKYKRNSSRGSWTALNLERALEAVQKGTQSVRQAAVSFSIPRETLRRRITQLRKGISVEKRLGRFDTVFPTELENELAEHLLQMESRFFGLNTLDVRRLAYQLAVKNNLPNNFCRESQLAGKEWLNGFRTRHPELSLRTPEKTSVARAQCFNKPTVEKFFKMLKDIMDDKKFAPHRIYNMDETAVTTVQSRVSKILAKKGKKQVGTLTSAERGLLITAVICMSATGHYVPPMLIYPRVRMKEELQCGAPTGTLFRAHPSGWMQSDLFVEWFKHFLQHTKPTITDPVLLILDGHASHTKNLEFIELARDNHVTVVSLPPHCTHRLQPLDVSFMGPLKRYYSQAIEQFLRTTHGQPVRQVNIAALFGDAYGKAALVATAENGFRRTGIFPLDFAVFTDEAFHPSAASDVPLATSDRQPSASEVQPNTAEEPRSASEVQPNTTVEPTSASEAQTNALKRKSQDEDLDFVGFEEFSYEPVSVKKTSPTEQEEKVSLEGINRSKELNIHPQDIMPLPQQVKRSVQKRGRVPEKAAVLTSDEFLNELRIKRMKKEKESDVSVSPRVIPLANKNGRERKTPLKSKVNKERAAENLPPLEDTARRKRKTPIKPSIRRQKNAVKTKRKESPD